MSSAMGTAAETGTDVRPFQVDIPEEELAELRRRIEATRWLLDDRARLPRTARRAAWFCGERAAVDSAARAQLRRGLKRHPVPTTLV
jgi:hypothetical protein